MLKKINKNQLILSICIFSIMAQGCALKSDLHKYTEQLRQEREEREEQFNSLAKANNTESKKITQTIEDISSLQQGIATLNAQFKIAKIINEVNQGIKLMSGHIDITSRDIKASKAKLAIIGEQILQIEKANVVFRKQLHVLHKKLTDVTAVAKVKVQKRISVP